MGNNTRNVRYPEWVNRAVAEFAKKNGFSSPSKAFIWLLSTQLNRYGYFEEDYTTKMADLPLSDDIPMPGETQNIKKLENGMLKQDHFGEEIVCNETNFFSYYF